MECLVECKHGMPEHSIQMRDNAFADEFLDCGT